MNKYKLFLSCAASLLLLSGCYDLDRYPTDQLSSGTFFKTQDHADQAMMAVYNVMQRENVFGIQFGFDCLGSVGMGYDNPSFPQIARGTYATDNGQVTNKWKHTYEGISRANIILQNIGNCEISEELKTQYAGEARFMRALFYFSLLDIYGGVPLYDETTIVAEDFSNMMKPRSSAEDTREFILKDLDTAISSLPANWDASYKGRATSGAAMALKGKVLLYAKKYTEAATCFENVIGSGQYALYSSYENLFKPGGDESSEMIFAIQNMGGVGTDYGMPMTFYMGSRSSYGSCWNNVMASTDFVDSYEWADGRPFDWEEVIPGFTTDDKIKDATFRTTLSDDKTKVIAYPKDREKVMEMYGKRDPRMEVTIILPFSEYKGWYSNKKKDSEYVIANAGMAQEANGFIRAYGNYECYLWRKFVAEYDMDGAINNRADTPINFPLIRYADVLLMLAECYNEMDNQPKAVELINQIRARVGMPGINSGPSYLQANSKDEVFKRIKHEREVELAAEGHSFSDLRRWGLLETVAGPVKGCTGKKYYDRVIRERDYLWPIPYSETSKNDALKTNQNPGW